ncbi:conserved exported hypothetical protein [Bradyrhizobium sp. STM 3843]|uniref:DUF3551 domain-containing protein n=1 Tax=Bradyrhizobium sp. STM 3843 TaxID=551947 RepID=UPI0002406BE0|nr:DUF3551 domain-containing protein [Bradyrhizobium sp. STM 3843]CCE05900.1 conserved exported hypothetical protein [Bradyrhizobium sp. STM 3843]
MRKLALKLLASAALLTGGAGHAQTYDPNFPVCLHTYGPNGYIDCRFRSLEQCKFNAVGRPADCELNPYFTTTAPARRRHDRR